MHKQRFDLIRTGMCLIILFFFMSSFSFPVVSGSEEALSKDFDSNSYRIPMHLLVVNQIAETPTETPGETPTETPEPSPTPQDTPTPAEETPTEVPEPTDTPVPEETPTEVPEPTATPESPTATPEPTEIPEPTDTPEPENPMMSISEAEVNVGEDVTVSVEVENFVDVDAFGFDIVQSNEILAFSSVDREGTLLEDFFLVNASELSDGTVRIAAAGGASSITGGGLLLNVNYTAQVSGETELSFENLVDDIEGAEITVGSVTVTEETPTATPEPTETPVDTPTPEPTDTPVPEPTETPVATETPTETPVETPEPTPSPTATSTPSPTPNVFENPNQGILLVDGFGGMHEVGDIAGFYDLDGNGELDDPTTTRLFQYFAGRDIYRDYELFIEEGEVRAVIAATGNGFIFSAQFDRSGEQVVVEPDFIAGLGIRFQSNNVLRDVEFTQNGTGYIALLSDGSLYRVEGKEGQPQRISQAFTNARNNPAVDFEILEEGENGLSAYILTANGRIKTVGEAPALSSPVSNAPIFRDMELYEGVAVLADGFGQFFIAAQEGQEEIPPIPLPEELVFGVDVLRDFEIQVDMLHEDYEGVGLVATTTLGTLHTAGAADYFLTEEGLARRPDVDIVTREDGTKYIDLSIHFDIIRDLELYILE